MNLPTTYDPNKLFPIMGGKAVLWEDAEKAYLTYVSIAGGRGQSLKRLGERGGFGDAEFAYYFQGLCPRGPNKWPVVTCPSCNGAGEIIDHEEGGLLCICGVCMGAGMVLPDPLPDCRKLEEKR